jgi:hypothetical protein
MRDYPRDTAAAKSHGRLGADRYSEYACAVMIPTDKRYCPLLLVHKAVVKTFGHMQTTDEVHGS